MSLSLIKDTVQKVADAITAALDIETEIVDDKLTIIGGTGRYADKIGLFEEEGKLRSNLVYATCIRTGHEYINFDPASDDNYDAKEGELAEICCPVKVNGETKGLIGLVAFDGFQREKLIKKTAELTNYLRIMAELIACEVIVSENNLKLQKTISSLLSDIDPISSFENIISVSSEMEKVKKRAIQVAHSDSTILITGESGTGKGLLARSIHSESERANEPFVSVNCAAIPEMLLESELFGYEKGAFTGAGKNGKLGKFQLADKGTIFLDEIGDMPLHLQVKLLTCLQNRQVDPVGATEPVKIDVRVIAATNKNLEKMIEEKTFREDLYFRLNVIPIYLPPLRERKEDIDVLLDFELKKLGRKLNKPMIGFSKEARGALNDYAWPGNVREIENVIEYAINMEEGNRIGVVNLPEYVIRREHPGTEKRDFSSSPKHEIFVGNLKEKVAAAEKTIIQSTLEETGSTLIGKRKAAEKLGISESTLYRKLREFGMLKKES